MSGGRTIDPSDQGSPAPEDALEETVRPEWIDYNGHMNVAYYVLVFDHATDAVLGRLGAGPDDRARTGCTVFVLEAHVTYEREVKAGERLRVTSRVLACDDKRLIIYHEMVCAGRDGIVATNEVLCLNVAEATRRAAPWPPSARTRIARATAESARLPIPARAGRAITLASGRPQ
jgi:acyl-CoA thioester hydrolase